MFNVEIGMGIFVSGFVFLFGYVFWWIIYENGEKWFMW